MTDVSHIWQITATTSIGIIVTLVTFWATIVRTMVTKAEVASIVENHSPYLQDRQFIMERLASNKENQTAFSTALQRNSEVMNELRIQMTILTKTLETLEERIDRN